jgi:AraC family transcriptional regulator
MGPHGMYPAPVITIEHRASSADSSGDLACSLAALLEAALARVDTDREAAKAFITKASSLLKVQISRQAISTPCQTTTGGLSGWQIRRIVEFIDCHLHDTIRVERLSEIAGLSATYFYRTFRRSFGVSPHAYLTRRRIERARHLILTSNMQLSQIAQECGFNDQAHLCRNFREQVGMSPATWRRENKTRVENVSSQHR